MAQRIVAIGSSFAGYTAVIEPKERLTARRHDAEVCSRTHFQFTRRRGHV